MHSFLILHCYHCLTIFMFEDVNCSTGGPGYTPYICGVGYNNVPGYADVECAWGRCNHTLCCVRTSVVHFFGPICFFSLACITCLYLEITCGNMNGDFTEKWTCHHLVGEMPNDGFDALVCPDGRCSDEVCCHRIEVSASIFSLYLKYCVRINCLFVFPIPFFLA